MNEKDSTTNHLGQSIVEALVIVVIVMILVTGLVVSTTTSLKNSRFSSSKASALKYAQEGIEIAREIRDKSWNELEGRENESNYWCLDKDKVWTETDSVSSVVDCQGNIDSYFTRVIEMKVIEQDKIEVVVMAYWRDGETLHESEVRSYLTNWK